MPNRCIYCVYWNKDNLMPRCWALKGRCNPNSQYCDYTDEK